METLGDRVRQRRSELKMTQGDLAKKVSRLGEKMTQQGVGTIETRGSVRPRGLEEISTALRTTTKWLISGQGQKEAINAGGELSNPSDIGIPEIDVRGGMGGGGVAETINTVDEFGNSIQADKVKGYWGIPDNFIRSDLRSSPKHIRIIEVMGDSMSPTLTSGDRVLIDTAHTTPSPPGIYSLWDGFGVIVKRIEIIANSDPVAIRVISDNEHHSIQTIELDGANIIGRVVCRVSAL